MPTQNFYDDFFQKFLFTCPLAFIFAVFQHCHGNGKKERAQFALTFL